MTDILNNEAVQTALIALIVVALNALAQVEKVRTSVRRGVRTSGPSGDGHRGRPGFFGVLSPGRFFGGVYG